ncbi:triacylglycerol esterase/lipase EstA (alpha/beta hydrolase family) [Kitasatospora gansuensis]|uniref:Triacylglycerol esterase/lipase EstA (Alpha/beta hydrolase family) n=1 Tax=Kitasatospora gansuensis TaxID=258050 RepID=A0A7W7SLD5_9ACTN|nr:triacylglycerol lipase [Kitasatospora gansuensis]MBB4951401.1 triacylglycerol esterase/lipase EstA (alpha/beta hydrolase family) [Kitasatospora gansuensis]
MHRRILPVAVALLSALAAAGPAAPAQAAGSAANPVIFVHGRNAGPGVWGTMTADFRDHGFPADRLFTWSYDTGRSTNEVLAGQLASYVEQVRQQTGAAQVDLVAHSLGSLPTRWYVRYGDGSRTVANWVSLAGPNHGTTLGYLCALWDQGCRDMTPNSYVVSHLNQGDETPGTTRYTTVRSSCDEQIAPTASTALAGATNLETGCLKHNDLLTDRSVAAAVRAALTP